MKCLFEQHFYSNDVRSSAEPLLNKTVTTGKDQGLKQPFKVSGNCPKCMQQMQKHLRNSPKFPHNSKSLLHLTTTSSLLSPLPHQLHSRWLQPKTQSLPSPSSLLRAMAPHGEAHQHFSPHIQLPVAETLLQAV